ncbi:MAG: methionyl-tRNA formyltransferase, partial [Acidobacteriota bacterium]|nr:methionyl-tRNA formyltransferase [Acidobacteriota bacterium]
EDGKIDWQLSAREILNRIRGFEPWPGGYGFLRGQRLQIWHAVVGEMKLSPGVLRSAQHKLFAGCGRDESIELREVQLEGKKRMPVAAFLNGFPLSGDEVLA